MRVFRGLTVTYSWRRALGLTRARQKIARKTGIPTTRRGFERKLGRAILRGRW